jgi:hypothetical protein
MSGKSNDRPNKLLHEKIDQLSGSQVDVVEKFVTAVLTPIYTEPISPTWLATDDWTEAFTSWLRGYHALSAEPLGRLQFEAAFNHACEAAGWRVEAAESATQRFYDTAIDDKDEIKRRLSLKASSAQDMTANKIHISKLTEGAWIQDARKQIDRRNRIVKLFQDYQDITSSIFILRGFRQRDHFQILYELIEIPTSIFDKIVKLTVPHAQAGTISIPAGTNYRNRDFAICIDRSDSKITLTGIRLDICVVHGRWGFRESAS